MPMTHHPKFLPQKKICTGALARLDWFLVQVFLSRAEQNTAIFCARYLQACDQNWDAWFVNCVCCQSYKYPDFLDNVSSTKTI